MTDAVACPPPRRRLPAGARSAAKRLASSVAAWSGLYRIARAVYGGMGVVFALHRVLEPGRPSLWPGYAIHADVLDEMLARTRRLGFEAIAIDELQRRVEAGEAGPPFVCLTFDDGYLDTLRVALPVLRRHEAPACVYVTTGLVERSAFYWWGAVEELVLTRDRVEWPGSAADAPRRLAAATWDEKCRAYHLLGDLCHRAGDGPTRELLRGHGVDAERLADRDFLTVAQTRALSAEPLVTVGAHCVTHERLSSLSDAAALLELSDARRVLEAWTGEEVRHLAYPFGAPGACGPREFALARQAGYATAVTTRRGNIFPAHREHLTALPRREIPTNVVALRGALSGVESVVRRIPTLQTSLT